MSRGYPGTPELGFVITGLDDIEKSADVIVFHAGTEEGPDGTIMTAGGRVLTLTVVAPDVETARLKALKEAKKIHFEGMYYREDIALAA